MKKRPNDVLVLNRGWVPVHIIEWQRAISLIYQGKANALDNTFVSYPFNSWKEFSSLSGGDEYYKVHSANLTLALPEIIVAITFSKLPDRQVKYSRQNVFTRDKCKCGYCNHQFPIKSLTVDHIIPRDLNGKTEWSNIITCCFPCNQKKANKTLKASGLRLAFKPHKPKWFSPLSNVNMDNHPCKSWKHFMKKIDTISSEDL